MKDSLSFSSNHGAFLAASNFSVVTSVDAATGNVWVTPLFGKSRDLNAVSENFILISHSCIPVGDILKQCQPGTPLSLLAIDLDKRQRHRINGVATAPSEYAATNLAFAVNEYSPNCPKYMGLQTKLWVKKRTN